jgi:hypothetical protein
LSTRRGGNTPPRLGVPTHQAQAACKAVTGRTACARRMVSGAASESP